MTAAWIDEVRAALDSEFGDTPRTATLATVDTSGRPRARTVVCRRVEGDGSLWIASDARSDKNAQASDRPDCEIVFWLARRRLQIRAAGSIEVIDGDDSRRSVAWTALSDSARAVYFWPTPGLPRSHDAAFPDRVATGGEIPESFTLLVIRPDRVERLDLNTHPHHRQLWSGTGWIDLNP